MVCEVELRNRGKAVVGVALLSPCDRTLGSHRWCLSGTGYAMRRMRGGGYVLLHRAVMAEEIESRAAELGVPVCKIQVDHVNRVALDCRRENLRVVTQAQNMWNTAGHSKGNRSGVKGVYWNSRTCSWLVQVSAAGVRHTVGLFKDLAEAVEARECAVRQLHGEAFGRIGSPSSSQRLADVL